MQDNLACYVKICISKSGGVHDSFGPGTASLLRGIRDMGSLNRATKAMEMSYSKAWRILNTAEEQLGFLLVDRNGANGSALTEKGERFLLLYERMQQSTNLITNNLLESSGLFD